MPNVMNIDVLALEAEVFSPHLATWPPNSPCDVINNESMMSQKLFSLWRGEDKIFPPQQLGHQCSSHLAWI